MFGYRVEFLIAVCAEYGNTITRRRQISMTTSSTCYESARPPASSINCVCVFWRTRRRGFSSGRGSKNPFANFAYNTPASSNNLLIPHRRRWICYSCLCWCSFSVKVGLFIAAAVIKFGRNGVPGSPTYRSPTIRLDKDCGLLHLTIYSFLLSDCLYMYYWTSCACLLSRCRSHMERQRSTTYLPTSPQHRLVFSPS